MAQEQLLQLQHTQDPRPLALITAGQGDTHPPPHDARQLLIRVILVLLIARLVRSNHSSPRCRCNLSLGLRIQALELVARLGDLHARDLVLVLLVRRLLRAVRKLFLSRALLLQGNTVRGGEEGVLNPVRLEVVGPLLPVERKGLASTEASERERDAPLFPCQQVRLVDEQQILPLRRRLPLLPRPLQLVQLQHVLLQVGRAERERVPCVDDLDDQVGPLERSPQLAPDFEVALEGCEEKGLVVLKAAGRGASVRRWRTQETVKRTRRARASIQGTHPSPASPAQPSSSASSKAVVVVPAAAAGSRFASFAARLLVGE